MSIYHSIISTSKSNTENFINKANLVHNDLYDYSEVEYIISQKIAAINVSPFNLPFARLSVQRTSSNNLCKNFEVLSVKPAN